VRSDTRQPALSAPGSSTARTENSDPLLALLQRYEAELAAFNRPLETEQITDQDWDRIARETWSHTQEEILKRLPRATTPAGALMALDHVLQNEELFAERDECANQRILWLLIKAARDYIASTEPHDIQH
jgi:hypothetical protein